MDKESSKKALDNKEELSQGVSASEELKTVQPKVETFGQTIGSKQPLQTQTEDKYDASIILDFDGAVDITFLEKKDPNYKYRYLNTNGLNLATKTSNLLLKGGGWQIVPKDHCTEVLGLRPETLASDGTYRVGVDLILARMPMDLYKKKEAHKIEEANKPMKAIDRMINKGDPELTGYGHDTIKGIQPKKALGDSWR